MARGVQHGPVVDAVQVRSRADGVSTHRQTYGPGRWLLRAGTQMHTLLDQAYEVCALPGSKELDLTVPCVVKVESSLHCGLVSCEDLFRFLCLSVWVDRTDGVGVHFLASVANDDEFTLACT